VGQTQPIPDASLQNPIDLRGLAGDALVVYVANVGDGDAIVIQFPEVNGRRAFGVVDSNNGGKSIQLLNDLGANTLAFVCATHPHKDHVSGLRPALAQFSGQIRDFWHPGFYYTSTDYNRLSRAVEQEAILSPDFRAISVSAGFELYVNGVRVTALAPTVAMKNQYLAYGLNINNASIVLRLDYPTPDISSFYPPAAQPTAAAVTTRSVILGGDAQTDAWGRVLEDHPHVQADPRNWYRLIGSARDRQPLACDVLKVAHHSSKHGINLELLERMGQRTGGAATTGPRFMITSCAEGAASHHGFPHMLAQEIMREVRQPRARAGGAASPDWQLGIHYTSQMIDLDPPTPAGGVAVVLHADGTTPHLYRLQDAPNAPINLANARRMN
jgi:hypothetical protein